MVLLDIQQGISSFKQVIGRVSVSFILVFLLSPQTSLAALTLTNQTETVLEDSGTTSFDVLSDSASVQTDADSSTLTLTGTLIYTGTGSVAVVDNSISYTPASNFTGDETITFEVSDGDGFIDAAVLTVTVTNVNDPPTAVTDAFTVSEDSSNNLLSVLLNDVDIDPVSTTLTLDSIEVSPTNGQSSISGNNLIYTPDPNFSGTDSISYIVRDQFSAQTTGTVTITVDPVNDAPVTSPGSQTISEDASSVIVNVVTSNLVTDSDSDSTDLSIVSAQVSAGSGSVDASGQTFTYIPATDFNGTAQVSYDVSDNHSTSPEVVSGTYTFTVTAVNDSPVANDDRYTINEDEVITLTPLDNDTDMENDSITIQSTTASINAATISKTTTSITYTPPQNFTGDDSFTYTIRDASGLTSSATISITVDALNDNPIAPSVSETVGDNTTLTIDLDDYISDTDSSNLSVTQISTPTYGRVYLFGNTMTYEPFANIGGTQTETLTYTVSDGQLSTTGLISIVVTTENDAPTPGVHTLEIAEDSAAIQIDVLATDTDPDGDNLTLSTAITADQGGTVSVSNKVINYQPAPDFFGTEIINYSVADTGSLTASGSVTVVVTPINDPPVIDTTLITIDEDVTAHSFNVIDNSSVTDVDNTASELTITSLQINSGTGTVSGLGQTVEYNPRQDFTGTAVITFTVSDGVASTTGTQSIEVSSIADSPVAIDDSQLTVEDSTITIDVLANDTDADGDDLVLISLGTPSQGGSAEIIDGLIQYTPSANFNGVETITYIVADADGSDPANPGLTDTGIVTITVSPIADEAVAVDDIFRIPSSTTLTILPMDNDINLDSLDIEILSVSRPEGGSLTNDGTVLTYTPSESFSGIDTFTYTISDASGLWTSQATVTIYVIPQTIVSECDTSQAAINSECGIDPTDFRVQVYGFGLCTGAPGAPTTTNALDVSNCHLLYDGLSGSVETITFGQSSSRIQFSGSIEVPPYGNYTHGLLILSNSFDMKGAVSMTGADPVTFCVTKEAVDGSPTVDCTASSASEAEYVTDSIDYFYDASLFSYRFPADGTDMYLTDSNYSLTQTIDSAARILAIQELPSAQNFSENTRSINIGLRVSEALITDGTAARTAPFGVNFSVE